MGKREQAKICLKEGESFSSPTVSLEVIFTTLVINSYEGKAVATFDVIGVYFNLYMPKDNFLLKLREKFMNITYQINLEHKKNMRHKNGNKVLYMLVLRVIYGCI